MHIVIDARRHEVARPITGPAFGATEVLIRYMAEALASLGHRVDVLCAEPQEHFVSDVYWWPGQMGPRKCDLLILSDQAQSLKRFDYEKAILWLTFSQPPLDGHELGINRYVCLSDWHAEGFKALNPGVDTARVKVLPPALDMDNYNKAGTSKEPHRLIWCNSPDRGLAHLMTMWPLLVEMVPDVSLSVTYNFDRYFESVQWAHDAVAVQAWEMKHWLEHTPNVVKHGPLDRDALVREQRLASVYAYPCDPPEAGSMAHCVSALECMAASCICILPPIESYPTVFPDACFIDRVTDYHTWAQTIVAALTRRGDFKRTLQRGRALAEHHGLSQYRQRWKDILEGLA